MKLKHKAFVTWGHESKSWLSEGVWNPFQERLIRKVSLEQAAAAHGYWTLQDNIISSSYHSSSSELSGVTPLFTRLLVILLMCQQKKSLFFLKHLENNIGKVRVHARIVRFALLVLCSWAVFIASKASSLRHKWEGFPRDGKIPIAVGIIGVRI